VLFDAVVHKQKSPKALKHGFYSSVAKQCLQKQCKDCPRIRSQTSRTIAPLPPPPEYATEDRCSRSGFLVNASVLLLSRAILET